MCYTAEQKNLIGAMIGANFMGRNLSPALRSGFIQAYKDLESDELSSDDLRFIKSALELITRKAVSHAARKAIETWLRSWLPHAVCSPSQCQKSALCAFSEDDKHSLNPRNFVLAYKSFFCYNLNKYMMSSGVRRQRENHFWGVSGHSEGGLLLTRQLISSGRGDMYARFLIA